MTSNRVRAIAPVMDPPDFPDPIFYPARRIHGLVETPASNEEDSQARAEDSGRPPSLMRSHSVTGNVLLLQHPQEGTKAFLLQRKVGTSAYGGSVRVGFCLQGDKPGEDGMWHVAPRQISKNWTTPTRDAAATEAASRKRNYAMMEDITDRCEMVTIYIESETSVRGAALGEPSSAPDTDSLKTELSAMQWIARQSKALHLDHLRGSTYMGIENGWICAVLSPWNSNGTLLDYIAAQPNRVLGQDEAKLVFKQVLQVRELAHFCGSILRDC